jgi:hypothetical protein
MDNIHNLENTLHEHRFWLQILGDHSRFIFFSLAPTESTYLSTAQEFIILFDNLLDESRKQLSDTELSCLNQQAYDAAIRLREFKLELLAMSITSDLKSHISSSFFNDMLNELDDYLTILNALMSQQNSVFHPIQYHLLWLSDAVGHSATIAAELDMVEKDLINKACRYEVEFSDLYAKALMMNGYLRTKICSFPSLDRLNEQAGLVITSFMEFLEDIRDQRLDNRVLGSLMPLMADHMAREECYYLWKLSMFTPAIRNPGCDPGRPRIEV